MTQTLILLDKKSSALLNSASHFESLAKWEAELFYVYKNLIRIRTSLAEFFFEI